jgi:hypothetical protein
MAVFNLGPSLSTNCFAQPQFTSFVFFGECRGICGSLFRFKMAYTYPQLFPASSFKSVEEPGSSGVL